MTGRWLNEAEAACGLPPPRAFPRDLTTEILLRLPITFVPLAGLTSGAVRDWLAQRGLHHRVANTPRSLHGCMVARSGRGVLFHDSEDDECEQRFTIAHEVAHFVLDHLLPRTRALRAYGEEIRPVLDGLRAPTPEESLSSALDRIPIGLQVKLMSRDPSGFTCTGKAAACEQRADRLALELLAPAPHALEVLKAGALEGGEARVAGYFGLPTKVARTYTRILLRRESSPRFSILELLEEDGR